MNKSTEQMDWTAFYKRADKITEAIRAAKLGATSGRTRDGRMKNIAYGLPFDLNVVYAWKAENARIVELQVHRLLNKHRTRNEWFKLEAQIVRKLIVWLSRVADGERSLLWKIATLDNLIKKMDTDVRIFTTHLGPIVPVSNFPVNRGVISTP